MRHFLHLLMFLVFTTITTQAQNISVKSFNLIENDMDARVTFSKHDQNGEVCAIIKVVTTQTDFDWEPDALGIVAAERKTGEYWLYVPRGARRLTIKHNKLGILRNYQYPIAIQAATVYVMELITARVTTIVEEEIIPTQWLVITSEPEGADVYINDLLRGQTPFSKEFEVGDYNYRLEKILYHPEAGKINLSSGKKENLDFKLRPNFGYIHVSTSPENGATVTVNGSQLPGNSPVKSGMLKSGIYNVEASKALFHSVSQQVTVTDGQTSIITLNMQPAFGGVTINTNPEQGAEVILNGNPTGKTTPASLERLPRGEHTITVRKEWYQPQTQRVTLNDGESKELSIAMQPTFGNVNITAEADASIYIANEFKAKGKWEGRLMAGIYTVEARRDRYHNDTKQMQVELGKTHNLSLHPKPMQGALKIETTPFKAKIILNGIDYGTTPNTIRGLLVGEYTLVLVKDDYGTVTKTITIAEGKTTEVNETLPSGMEITIVSNPSGAQLSIDGVPVGSTPFTTMLSFGNHNLKLVNEKKILNEDIFIKQDGKNKWEFDVQIGKDISIGSNPIGLEVMIDGINYGKTPVRTNISYGKHNIKIVNGNRVVEETIDVNTDEKVIWIFNVEDFEPEMVFIRGGSFVMGCTSEQGLSCFENEKPSHSKTVDDFYIGKYEITVSQFKAFVDDTGYKTDADRRVANYGSYIWDGKNWIKKDGINWHYDVKGNKRHEREYNHPVIHISWNDAIAYCEWLSKKTGKKFRLPSESEWEYAARGGQQSNANKYAGSKKVDEVAWFTSNSSGKTQPVGQKKPNELGLFDMNGNVAEWCADDWHSSYIGAISYGRAWNDSPRSSNRVFRGGGWNNNAQNVRVSIRSNSTPDSRFNTMGFRVVCTQ